MAASSKTMKLVAQLTVGRILAHVCTHVVALCIYVFCSCTCIPSFCTYYDRRANQLVELYKLTYRKMRISCRDFFGGKQFLLSR